MNTRELSNNISRPMYYKTANELFEAMRIDPEPDYIRYLLFLLEMMEGSYVYAIFRSIMDSKRKLRKKSLEDVMATLIKGPFTNYN